MEIYNSDKIIKVEVLNFVSSAWYSFKYEYKLLGIVLRKTGVYDSFGSFIGNHAPNDNLVIMNNDVLVKPKVVIHYEANHEKRYYFDSYEEAVSFYNMVTSSRRFLTYGKSI